MPHFHCQVLQYWETIVAAFRGIHVLLAKHSYAWLTREFDYRTHTQTDRQTDTGQSDLYVPLCFSGDTIMRYKWRKNGLHHIPLSFLSILLTLMSHYSALFFPVQGTEAMFYIKTFMSGPRMGEECRILTWHKREENGQKCKRNVARITVFFFSICISLFSRFLTVEVGHK